MDDVVSVRSGGIQFFSGCMMMTMDRAVRSNCSRKYVVICLLNLRLNLENKFGNRAVDVELHFAKPTWLAL